MHQATWASLFGLVVAVSPAAQAQVEADREIDPTQQATIELQQREDRQEAGEGFTLHGATYLQYNAPLYDMGGFDLSLTQLEVKYDGGSWGLYSTPRLKITNFAHVVDKGYLYFQQIYATVRHDLGEIKVGKVYGRFGRFWDYGFYGPLMANNDLKLTPDFGVSAEGAPNISGPLDLEYALQYFLMDGRAVSVNNASLFSFASARRRNVLTARAAPVWRFNSQTWTSIGVSAQRYDSSATDNHSVGRGAVDLNGQYGPASAFVEVGRQRGGDRVAGRNLLIASHTYLWTGAELRLGAVSMRYHFNTIQYDDKATTLERLHQPGIEVAVNDNMGVMGEMVLWTTTNAATGRGEQAFYVIANGRF
jgi:hypothetical protein